MERKPHNPSGSIIDKLTGRRGFLGAVVAGVALAGATACGRSSGETKTAPSSTPSTEAASGAPTSAAPTPEKTATPTPEAKPKFTYAELNSNLREWDGVDDITGRLSATSGEEARRKILEEFFGNENNNGGLSYPELDGVMNNRCGTERVLKIVERATTELSTIAALLSDVSVSEESKNVIKEHYCELFMKPNSTGENPVEALSDIISDSKTARESTRCNLFNMSGGKTESKNPPIPGLPAVVAISSDKNGECIIKRRTGERAATTVIQVAFVPKELKSTVDSEGKITGYEVDEESGDKSPVRIIDITVKSSDSKSALSGSVWAVSNIKIDGSQTTMTVDGEERLLSELRAK